MGPPRAKKGLQALQSTWIGLKCLQDLQLYVLEPPMGSYSSSMVLKGLKMVVVCFENLKIGVELVKAQEKGYGAWLDLR